MSADQGLASFHPLIRSWFTETYGKPTGVQEAAWPLIAGGSHVLALAPTGSGKTLTAFLAALSRLASGEYPADTLSVLYISPLKALNEDIRRNLLEPLNAIRARFEAAGILFPEIRAESRSGDTPQSERRRFLRTPPAILAVTPESLAILLLNPRGRQVLSRVQYLILDEVHAVLGTKRGSFLACQIGRLALLAGEFQRVGLSATVRPPEEAADFMGGLRALSGGGYEPRPVRIVAPPQEKEIRLLTDFPEGGKNTGPTGELPRERYGPRYSILTDQILERIEANRPGALGTDTPEDAPGPERGTTLVFTDSRRRAERISFLVNERVGKTVAFAHHGSLSREVRRAVEARLARGLIPCVVATGSLELGIDIGSVVEVILAGSPGSSAVTLQRIGRSGHGVGMVSRGRLIPFHGLDLIAAAALGEALADREIEESRSIENPLDVLAQITLALCAEKSRTADELYQVIRGFYPFKTLPWASYEGVLGMLTGRYGKERIRELKPRLYREAGDGDRLTAVSGVLPLLYSSGGVITNRGSYSLRLSDGTKIGELDEEFVWERRLGDSFDFGNRPWTIVSIGAEAVEVIPRKEGADYTPFWKGETTFRSPVLVRRILDIFDLCNRRGPDALDAGVFTQGGLSPAAREALKDFIRSQQRSQGRAPLPGSDSLPIEIIDERTGRGVYTVILHSFRGGAVNYPLSLALAQEMEETLDLRVESIPDDNGILLLIPRFITGDITVVIRQILLRLGEGRRWEGLFKKRLESSGVFGAAFREAAERSLLLPKAGFGKRTPLWITRQRAKRLFDAMADCGDFPVTAEAWRSCLRDQFDPAGTEALLRNLSGGGTELFFFKTPGPSPFARELVWRETNTFMYEYDERPDLRGKGYRRGEPEIPGGPGEGSLADRVITEALDQSRFRPRLSAAAVADFSGRLRREIPGWTAEDELGLAEWVKERIAIPGDEWEILLAALPQELRESYNRDPSLGGKIRLIRRPGAALPSVVHREWAETWEEEGLTQLGPWLRYEGPLPLSRISALFGLRPAEGEAAVDALVEAGELVRGVALTGGAAPAGDSGDSSLSRDRDDLICDRENCFPGYLARDWDDLICDRENLELLLRVSRRRSRPLVRERPAALLIPYLARRQGLLFRSPGRDAAGTGPENRSPPWERLRGFVAPVKLWESDFFPARQEGYQGRDLDREIGEGKILWYGAGKGRAGFCRPEELDLVLPDGSAGTEGDFPGDVFFDRPRDFWEIKDHFQLETSDCAKLLLEAAWQGRLTADSWEPIRRGITLGWTPGEGLPEGPEKRGGIGSRSPGLPGFYGSRRLPRALRDRWKHGAPVQGHWFSLDRDYSGPDIPDSGDYALGDLDPWDEEELNRGRVRLLLERWGVLCRPLLEREEPPLSWGRLLPAMRRMELAGELTVGRFFAGINSLQFAAPGIVGELELAESQGGIYWMNAADPGSPAGLGLTGLDPRIPPRLASSRLCFRGTEFLAAANRGARDLRLFFSPEDPDLMEALAFLKVPRTRQINPEKRVLVETINGNPAALSPYGEALKALGFVPDRGKLILW
ncbi:MAG: DEAD/DEAH box helicase [Treponema sp.]|jgi:ATP-dependent Lhr-like helicase|nr:DEAD/DEAH box helicase [Treponema sp.]